jgi:hypothetical protein
MMQDKCLAAHPAKQTVCLLRFHALELLACACALAWLAFVVVPALDAGVLPLAAERRVTAAMDMHRMEMMLQSIVVRRGMACMQAACHHGGPGAGDRLAGLRGVPAQPAAALRPRPAAQAALGALALPGQRRPC